MITQDDLDLEMTEAPPEPEPAEAELSKSQDKAIEALRDGRTLTVAGYQKITRVSKRTATRHLNELVEKGWLVREGRGSRVTYRLAPGR